MGNIHLVTGYAGQAHVTAADQASLNAAIFGEGQFVLQRGSQFAATVISNNSIRVADGDIIMQGRHIRLNEGSHVDLTIENGTQGTHRNDLIVARYTKDSLTGVEDCNLVVIKGTESTGTATDPAYTNGDIINGHVLIADMPLYRISLDGLNVQAVVELFTVLGAFMEEIQGAKEIADRKTELVTASANLPVAGWSNKKQSVATAGVKTNSTVFVVPNPESKNYTAYTENNVRCISQGNGTLTFECDSVPDIAVVANVAIFL